MHERTNAAANAEDVRVLDRRSIEQSFYGALTKQEKWGKGRSATTYNNKAFNP